MSSPDTSLTLEKSIVSDLKILTKTADSVFINRKLSWLIPSTNNHLWKCCEKRCSGVAEKEPELKVSFNNFRPVTLINAEMNILVKLLAKRLGLVLDTLVDVAQNCTSPNRSIYDSAPPHAIYNRKRK